MNERLKTPTRAAGVDLDIIKAVPIGSDNARTARDIFSFANSIWTETTFVGKLNALVDTGDIKRRPEQFNRGYRHYYWRNGEIAK